MRVVIDFSLIYNALKLLQNTNVRKSKTHYPNKMSPKLLVDGLKDNRPTRNYYFRSKKLQNYSLSNSNGKSHILLSTTLEARYKKIHRYKNSHLLKPLKIETDIYIKRVTNLEETIPFSVWLKNQPISNLGPCSMGTDNPKTIKKQKGLLAIRKMDGMELLVQGAEMKGMENRWRFWWIVRRWNFSKNKNYISRYEGRRCWKLGIFFLMKLDIRKI